MVAIGNKLHRLLLLTPFCSILRPIIVILHYHQQVARGQFLFASQYLVAYALVKDVGTFVRACHHHGLVQSHLAIAACQSLYQLVARHHLDIRKSVELHLRQSNQGDRFLIERVHIKQPVPLIETNPRRIPQDATLLALPQHLVERTLIYVQTEAT